MTGPDGGAGGPRRPHPVRIAGALFVLLALAAAGLARGFRVSFPADPVGPRALPLLAAGLLALGGVALLLRPGPRGGPAAGDGPGGAGATGEGGAPSEARAPGEGHAPGEARSRLIAAVVVFAVYPTALPTLGFIATTGATMSGLALLFDGPPLRAVAALFGLAGALYLLFAYGLGVPLPIGSLFLARGG